MRCGFGKTSVFILLGMVTQSQMPGIKILFAVPNGFLQKHVVTKIPHGYHCEDDQLTDPTANGLFIVTYN